MREQMAAAANGGGGGGGGGGAGGRGSGGGGGRGGGGRGGGGGGGGEGLLDDLIDGGGVEMRTAVPAAEGGSAAMAAPEDQAKLALVQAHAQGLAADKARLQAELDAVRHAATAAGGMSWYLVVVADDGVQVGAAAVVKVLGLARGPVQGHLEGQEGAREGRKQL